MGDKDKGNLDLISPTPPAALSYSFFFLPTNKHTHTHTHTHTQVHLQQAKMSAPQQGNQDYLDKAFNAGAKKFGGAQGQKIAGNRAMSEKIVRFSLLPPTLLQCGEVSISSKIEDKKENENQTKMLTAVDGRNAQSLRKGYGKKGQSQIFKLEKDN